MGKKDDLLGMSFGAASNKLRKAVMFRLAQRLGEDKCFRCGKLIETVDELSVEHKTSWQSASDPVKEFFDLDNVTFSHLKCNTLAADRSKPDKMLHGISRYRFGGCRCRVCLDAKNAQKKRNRDRKRGRVGVAG